MGPVLVRAGAGLRPPSVRAAAPGDGAGSLACAHRAAIRMLGDWLVVSQVIPVNPAAAVRGPKHVVTTGATGRSSR